MENYQYRYAGVAHSQPGTEVMFMLERQDGGQFGVSLTAEDAERLIDDLQVQVRIAKSGS